MGAQNSRGGAPPGGVFGACCSSPANDAEKIFPTPLEAAPRIHGRQGGGGGGTGDHHVSGMRLLLEAEEKSKNILLEAKQKRLDTLGLARQSATEESTHFESSYRREIAKQEAQLAKDIAKYETTIVTQHEKQLNKELSHASKRHEAAVTFLCTHTMHVRLELTVNAQELILEQAKRRRRPSTKHESSSTASSSKVSSVKGMRGARHSREAGPAPDASPPHNNYSSQESSNVIDRLRSRHDQQQAKSMYRDTSAGSTSTTRHHNTPQAAAPVVG